MDPISQSERTPLLDPDNINSTQGNTAVDTSAGRQTKIFASYLLHCSACS